MGDITTLLKTIFQDEVTEYEFIEESDGNSLFVVAQGGEIIGINVVLFKNCFLYACCKVKDFVGKPLISFEEANQVTACILLMHADHMTAWNIRKCLCQEFFLTLHDELKFSKLVLLKHPKRSEVFIYRRWILKEFLKKHPEDCKALIQQECVLCEGAAERYSCNYYAWSHRSTALQMFSFHKSCEFLQAELLRTEKFSENHVSDVSGFSYRLFIIQNLCQNLNDDQTVCKLLHSQLEKVMDLIDFYGCHETFLHFLRSLLFMYSSFGKNVEKTWQFLQSSSKKNENSEKGSDVEKQLWKKMEDWVSRFVLI